MIQHTARCPDDNLRPFFQSFNLLPDRLAAIQRNAADSAVVGQFINLAAHLDCQFARRTEDQRLGAFLFASRFKSLEDRYRKRSRLPGTGSCLAEHILAGERVGDQSGLDGSRLQVLRLLERHHHFRRQCQFDEFRNLFF